MGNQEKKLLQAFRALPEGDRATLLAFAEFLVGRVQRPPVASEPKPIPRPGEEKVIHAIRRLRETYPMLDHGRMLHEVSHLMTQHVMQGRPAREVIDELEGLFRAHYERFVAQMAE